MAMLGKVEDLVLQVQSNSRLKKALTIVQDYLAGRTPEISRILANLQPGETTRIPIEGDALYLLIQCYKARSREQARFEAHQRHTDLQYICHGTEWVEICDLRSKENLPAYDSKANVFFPVGTEAHSRLLLKAGDLAVLFPTDAHAPCLRVDGSEDQLIRKIVVKVKDALAVQNGLAGEPCIGTDLTTGV